MRPNDLPTADRPLEIDAHRFYMLGAQIQVVEYRGDVTLEQMQTILEVTQAHGGQTVALIRDLKQLGTLPFAARKRLMKADLTQLAPPGVELRIYVTNLNVLKRALVRMVATGLGTLTQLHHSIHPTGTLPEAIALARRYVEEVTAAGLLPP